MGAAGGVNYFELTKQFEQGYVTERLKELSAYYSNRMSYEEVEKLLYRQTGQYLLSDQTIWQIVVDKAVEVSQQMKSDVSAVLAGFVMPEVEPNVDIYDAQHSEILLFDDAIGVKEQKSNREKLPDKWQEQNQQSQATINSRVNTDVMMLEKATGGFQYLSAGIAGNGEEVITLPAVVQSKIIEQYGDRDQALPIVAISDGAKAIRARMIAIFGVAITIILDWYHLCKKVREFISMIAINKKEKQQYLEFIFDHLWRGKTEQVLLYLSTQVKAKNPDKLKDLIGYIEKHKVEIIDYQRRQKTGKTIGSGRMEKGVDQVIGYRQKKKGMSWVKKGSKALAILKVVELNDQWQDLWFPDRIAA